MEEEDKVEEIEREESRPQAVRILRKRGDEVVVMEEEDTTRELIKRMEPLVEENEKLKEVMKLMEKNIQRAQRERDLAESNTRDLEFQKGSLSKQLKIVHLRAAGAHLRAERDVELSRLCQVTGQLQEEKEKASGRAEKLFENLEEYHRRTKA
ncbi:uncharacterized protein [Miscanthus floridulus]|uniref:uncharacterized protein n=1 Tax=Miscanthus floridulus TaxID=154761 RepID=UPI003459052E